MHSQSKPFSHRVGPRLQKTSPVMTTSAGLDHIDIAQCRCRGIAIANAENIFSEDVADLVVGLLIDVLRHIFASEFVKQWLRVRQTAEGDYYSLGLGILGLPIGQHISCRGRDGLGEEVIKPYTPTTLDSDIGYFELVIKMYPQGRMSHHFRELQEGDYLAVKGPKGRFKYQPGQVEAFGMLARGTGIAPMFQVARAILENPNDKTNEELDNLATSFSDRFRIYYVLNQPPEEWDGDVGFILQGNDSNPLPGSSL